MKKTKVVIQYPFIALYRVPVFRKLVEKGRFEYVFWAGRESPDKFLKSAFDESGLPIEEVPLKTLRIPLLNKVLEFQGGAFFKLIRTRPNVYIILANPNSITSWLCMLVGRLVGSKVLAWSHGFLADEKGMKGLLRTLFYKIPHGHLLYGNRAKEIMVKKGFDPQRIDVIYNSLDYEKQAVLRESLDLQDRFAIRQKLGIPENSLVLIAIGRLMNKLKLDRAIEAVKRLNEAGRPVSLLIVGDGPEKNNLVGLSERIGVSDKVIFYGASYSEEELSRLFNAADISVVMGKVGLSAMHSLAYGVPMLTNSSMEKHFPEIEVVRENETGWFFEEDNIEDFVSKVVPLDYRGAIYRNCIAAIERDYTPERQLDCIEKAICRYV